MARTISASTPVAEDNGSAPEEIASVVQEAIFEEVVASSFELASSEPVYFLTEWIAQNSKKEPELYAMFGEYARQNSFIADTPSGWKEKFSGWISLGG